MNLFPKNTKNPEWEKTIRDILKIKYYEMMEEKRKIE